jgi:hypothetical protein
MQMFNDAVAYRELHEWTRAISALVDNLRECCNLNTSEQDVRYTGRAWRKGRSYKRVLFPYAAVQGCVAPLAALLTMDQEIDSKLAESWVESYHH